MTIYLNNDFHYETENLVRLFFPNDKITVVKELPDEKPLPLISALISDEGSEKKIFVSVETEGRFLVDERSVSIHTQDLQKTLERTLAVLLYGLLNFYILKIFFNIFIKIYFYYIAEFLHKYYFI